MCFRVVYLIYLDIDRPVVSEKFIAVQDKKNVQIQCNLDEPNVVWRKHGNVLSTTKHLSIMNVSAKDSGLYDCNVSNVKIVPHRLHIITPFFLLR